MKHGFYPRLAAGGIRNNKKLYFPYILTCVGMVMMTYIIAALSATPLLRSMEGGSSLSFTLGFGTWVIIIFSLIFLYYTNSFLIRRRAREFGLYNVLGMDKRSIGHIIGWESLLISGGSLLAGLGLGIVFSKLAELGLFNILGLETDFDLRLSTEALTKTALSFAVIFFIVYLRARILVGRSDPLRLMKAESYGEKPPRANFVLALFGIALLGGAYYLAVSIKSPIKAMALFFVAVVMVILATYLLMIAGSVTVCRILQKNKSFYYKKRHFVSLSSMAYRMKRNGAGLASVCILCTMVLVMLTSTGSLYIGAEDCMRARFPRAITASVYLEHADDLSEEQFGAYRDTLTEVVKSNGATPKNTVYYRYSVIYGALDGSFLTADSSSVSDMDALDFDSVVGVYLLSLDDYNRISGENVTLGAGEALLAASQLKYNYDTLNISDADRFTIVGSPDFDIRSIIAMPNISPTLYLVVSDYDAHAAALSTIDDGNGGVALSANWFCGLDTGADREVDLAIVNSFWDSMSNEGVEGNFVSFSLQSLEENRNDFYMGYGGLFFIGIILSIVFLFAAILILYYKQVCEGYEDKARFEIMQNVGMTGKDIRRSVDGQMLTVFFLPLITAGLHLSFAFPMIWRMLQLFSLTNRSLAVTVTVSAFLVFALFYVLVWRITSNAYCTIVRAGRE